MAVPRAPRRRAHAASWWGGGARQTEERTGGRRAAVRHGAADTGESSPLPPPPPPPPSPPDVSAASLPATARNVGLASTPSLADAVGVAGGRGGQAPPPPVAGGRRHPLPRWPRVSRRSVYRRAVAPQSHWATRRPRALHTPLRPLGASGVRAPPHRPPLCRRRAGGAGGVVAPRVPGVLPALSRGWGGRRRRARGVVGGGGGWRYTHPPPIRSLLRFPPHRGWCAIKRATWWRLRTPLRAFPGDRRRCSWAVWRRQALHVHEQAAHCDVVWQAPGAIMFPPVLSASGLFRWLAALHVAAVGVVWGARRERPPPLSPALAWCRTPLGRADLCRCAPRGRVDHHRAGGAVLLYMK